MYVHTFDFDIPFQRVPIKHNPQLLDTHQGVIDFVNSYNRYDDDFRLFRVYHYMIKTAIQTNNIEAFEGLCQGLEGCVLMAPMFDDYVKMAFECGSLETVYHCLYLYKNRDTRIPLEPIYRVDLIGKARKNTDVRVCNYALAMPEKTVISNEDTFDYQKFFAGDTSMLDELFGL